MNQFEKLLQLPDRAKITRGIPRQSRQTVMQLDGSGCIRHIALVTRDLRRNLNCTRDMILCIDFDDVPTPQVVAPFLHHGGAGGAATAGGRAMTSHQPPRMGV